jgi:hypothetical protein
VILIIECLSLLDTFNESYPIEAMELYSHLENFIAIPNCIVLHNLAIYSMTIELFLKPNGSLEFLR